MLLLNLKKNKFNTMLDTYDLKGSFVKYLYYWTFQVWFPSFHSLQIMQPNYNKTYIKHTQMYHVQI